ncbi:hypothetical protein DVH24_038667 [Malus domestica]|uniref:Uncharacterized protein n=1 Tax=Malus domestica TaxID=3750 RepID=A0A498KFY4_MALDO|nr:hypothetical protein DVH24_038667 [Malus domestica]
MAQNPYRGFRNWIERGRGRQHEKGRGRSRGDPLLRVSQLGGHAEGEGAIERGGKGRVGISAPLLRILDFMSGRGGTLIEKHRGRRDLREKGRDRGQGSGFVPLAKGACSVFKSYTHHRKGPARFRSMGLQTTVWAAQREGEKNLTERDIIDVVADFAAHSSFTVIVLNPENEPRASKEVEKPPIEPYCHLRWRKCAAKILGTIAPSAGSLVELWVWLKLWSSFNDLLKREDDDGAD